MKHHIDSHHASPADATSIHWHAGAGRLPWSAGSTEGRERFDCLVAPGVGASRETCRRTVHQSGFRPPDRSEPNPAGVRTRRRTSTESRAPAAAVPTNRTGLECSERRGTPSRTPRTARRIRVRHLREGGARIRLPSGLPTRHRRTAAANPVAPMPSDPCTTNPGHRACRPQCGRPTQRPRTACGARHPEIRLEPDTRQTADAGAAPPTFAGRTDRTADGDTPTRTGGTASPRPRATPPPRDPTPARRSGRGHRPTGPAAPRFHVKQLSRETGGRIRRAGPNSAPKPNFDGEFHAPRHPREFRHGDG